MEKLTLTLHKTKDTKNKVVYGAKGGDVIQSVYIDKDALDDVPPATLQVVYPHSEPRPPHWLGNRVGASAPVKTR